MPDEIRAPESDRQLAELAIDNADTPDVNWRGLALDLAERLLGSAGLAPISTLTGEPCDEARAAAGPAVSDHPASYLSRYLSVYEIGPYPDGPWPDDPDGGELRIVMALQRILAETDHADVRAIVQPIFETPGANAGIKFPIPHDLPGGPDDF